MIYLGQDLHAARWNGKALHGAAHGLHLVLEHSYFSMELEILLRQRTLHSSCTRHLHELLHAVAAAFSTADMVLARERERGERVGKREGGREREIIVKSMRVCKTQTRSSSQPQREALASH